MTDDILQTIITIDNYDTDKDFENYKLWRNKFVSLIRNSKREYYIHIAEQGGQEQILLKKKSKGDRNKFWWKKKIKKIWAYMKELNPKDSAPATAYLMGNETKITDPTEIAEFSNNTFIHMLTKYIKNENRAIS